MSAKILDGRALAQTIKDDLRITLQEKKIKPGLAVILVGENAASARYVSHKERACAEVGIDSTCHHLPSDTTQAILADLIVQLNKEDAVHGILLQLPLPDHLDSAPLLSLIDPKKDVDGFHPYNAGCLMQRQPALRACTPYGIMLLLAEAGVSLSGKVACVVGASNIVGRPMAMELLLAKCTVTVCHRFTLDLASQVSQADIVISAVGKPGVVDAAWIKPGAIIIDVGINESETGLKGDIDFNAAAKKASWITPVPGGVGPMTVAVLLKNTVKAAL